MATNYLMIVAPFASASTYGTYGTYANCVFNIESSETSSDVIMKWPAFTVPFRHYFEVIGRPRIVRIGFGTLLVTVLNLTALTLRILSPI